MVGMFAVSLAGHDKGTLYVILKEENNFLYLSDGKNHKLENPKKKSKKHLQIIKKELDDRLQEKIMNQQTIYNEEIRCAVKTRLNRR